MILKSVIVIAVITTTCSAWDNLPSIPSGRRSQYFLLQPNGGYKYGYDTGIDHSAKQAASSNNEVSGHYFYTAPTGQQIDLKYTAGINGFVPEGLLPPVPIVPLVPVASPIPPLYDDQSNTGDASYSFTIDTDSYKRQENSDASGNVQGKYSYTNQAGTHEISYVAGSNTGFQASSGPSSLPIPTPGVQITPPVEASNQDASYAFSYNNGDSSRQEGADSAGNVEGRYSFINEAGSHDLSYSAGADTGFIVTGGSLAVPNGLTAINPTNPQTKTTNTDGSYAFSYSNGDSSRSESSDASGNIQGNYAFTNEAGSHDLSYKAGAETGFVVTGGSLSIPNGVSDQTLVAPQIPIRQPSGSSDDQANTGDASYKFSIDTDEYKRDETADSVGNVQGHFSYKNSAGTHDLSYVAGAETGFVATGGSLKPAPGLNDEQLKSGSSGTITPIDDSTDQTTEDEQAGTTEDSQSNSGDSSYSFTIDTDEYKRQESSDAAGNVQGTFSYKNSAGTHDLSYVAGSETGFVATGGSLKPAPGLTEPQLKIGQAEATVKSSVSAPAIPNIPISAARIPILPPSDGDDEANTGDASYKFSIDTDEYKRQEESDAAGNIKGSFSYKNSVGTHDLSFIAGAETGFVPTGGSLQTAPGVSEGQLKSGQVEAKKVQISSGVESYLPPVIPLIPSTNSVDEASSGDASYKFSIDTDEYKRQEESDASGNVKGTYSYKNSAGTHDLSYKAGAETGFVAEGGSLKTPPGLSETQLRAGSSGNGVEDVPAVLPRGDFNDESSSGDASYSFTIDTDDYKRKESSDAAGNVQGHFSYKNAAGSHELSYVAGANTGFVATDGSLKTPPGVSEHQLKTGVVPLAYYPPQVPHFRTAVPTPFVPISPVILPIAGNQAYNLNNFWVKTYLPPSNDKQKFGYVFDSQ